MQNEALPSGLHSRSPVFALRHREQCALTLAPPRARARACARARPRGPCNRTRPGAHASFETFRSKAPETVGFRVSGGHGQVTTVNIFNFNRVASHLGGVGFHTIARVDTPNSTTAYWSVLLGMVFENFCRLMNKRRCFSINQSTHNSLQQVRLVLVTRPPAAVRQGGCS